MMNIGKALLALGMVVLTARPAAAADSAYTYEPFPRLPTGSVQEHHFAMDLRDACENLAKFPKDPNVPEAKTEADVPKAVEIAAQLAEARALPKPKVENAPKVATYVPMLGHVCAKLRNPKKEELNKTDLSVLRTARDAPGALAFATKWNGNFEDSVKGFEGKLAGGNVAFGASLGSLSDNLIRGMAEFLEKRAQAEALRYLRKQLKAQLCDTTDALLTASFSNTCAALNTLDDGMSLQALGSYIRAAAEKDLRKFPDLILHHTQVNEGSELGAIALTARLGMAYFAAVKEGRGPFEVLYSLGSLADQKCKNQTTCGEIMGAVRVASAFAYALRQGGTEWTDLFNAQLGENDRPVVAIAVVLLAEKRLADLQLGGFKRDFTFDVNVIKSFLITPLDVISDGITLAEIWTSLEERLDKAQDESTRRDILADAMVQSTERFTAMLETLDRIRTGKTSTAISNGAKQARAFVGIVAELVQRNYGAAMVSTLESLDKLPTLNAMKVSDKIAGAAKKYLPLIVEIASAQSSNDVAAAFDAYAAPLGTYELKYEKPMLALNGFLGGFYGDERMDSNGLEGTSEIAGVFAPIGVHGSLPIDVKFSKIHVGALLSLIDVGALTTTRTGKEPTGDLVGASAADVPTASEAPQIGFAQVFSPGAYGVLGLFESPVVVGFGVSLSPELREVEQSGLKTDISVLRYIGFLAVDVPMFPLN